MGRIASTSIVVVAIVTTLLLTHFFPRLQAFRTLGAVIAIIALTQFFWTTFIFPIFLSPLRHIPGPKNGNFLLGHGPQVRLSMPRGEVAREWMDTIPNDGLLRFRDFLNKDGLLLTSPAMMKAVLNDNCYDYTKQKSTVNILRPILGDGLVLVEGDVHKFQRRHLQASFQGHVIRELYPLFWNKSCELVQMLNDHVNEPEIELGVWFTRATLDIIGVAGFGRDFSSLKNPDDQFVRDYQELVEPKKENMLFFLLGMFIPYRFLTKIPIWRAPRDLKRISTSLFQFGYNMSKERRAEFAEAKIPETQKDQRKDILSLLVKSNDFTDTELSHQSLTMLAAGHETTSSTLSWCIVALAQNPQIQTALREEIRTHLPSPRTAGNGHTNNNTNAIDSLPLLNAVCNETLRFHPVVHITSRRVARPTRLGNYDLPINANVYIVPWAINRSTRFWGDDAAQFNPYRWIDVDPETGKAKVNGHGGTKSSYEFMTFLHGPRSCIGQGFARSELKHLLAALIGRFEFTLSRDAATYQPIGMVTSKPIGGTWARVREVEGW